MKCLKIVFKKVFVLLVLLSGSGSVFAYTMRVTNGTNDVINFIAQYEACREDSVTISPGNTATIDMYACCARFAKIAVAPANASLVPSLALGWYCRSVDFTIKKTSDGYLRLYENGVLVKP